jgi:hypothetical protein
MLGDDFASLCIQLRAISVGISESAIWYQFHSSLPLKEFKFSNEYY